jgi:hypothetical protein
MQIITRSSGPNGSQADRYLAFGDRTPVPTDGTVVYHNTATGQDWIQNTDGTVTPAHLTTDGGGNTVAAPDGLPSIAPLGYRRAADGKWVPVDARGNQVAPLQASLPSGTNFHGDPNNPNGIWTPVNNNGDYYTFDPTTGQRNFFDKNGHPISEEQYQKGAGQQPQQQPQPAPTGQPPAPGQKAPLQSKQVNIPDGMVEPKYPSWATDVDPDIPNQMTAVIVRLYELFGSGTPATSDLAEFPFSTDTGEKSGIDNYDKLRTDFKRIETEFGAAAKAYKTAVQNSANVTQAGRNAINNAIGTFNSTATTLDEGDWDGLLQAESKLLDTVKTEVQNAAQTQQNVPANPSGGPETPMTPPGSVPGMPPGAADPSLLGSDQGKDLDDLLSRLGSPFGAGMPMGANPLGGLGGLNPLSGIGSPMGGGGSPSPLSDAVKPLTKLADTDRTKDNEKSPIAPLNTGPQNPPPAATAPGATPGGPAAPGTQPAVTPAGNSTPGTPTVTLPGGQVVDAPNPQAAQAAQNALDHASPGGDAAQKAYSPTGLELPGDGKNLGARVDPSDVQPGDVLKWQDKTMVAAAPGLVADPTQPGVTHTLEEVLKDQKGFDGIFRPTEADPTLTAHTTPPPLHDPQPPAGGAAPPPATQPAPQAPAAPPPAPPAVPAPIPLSGPGPAGNPPPPQGAPAPSAPPGDAAPPSPFEGPQPPPATRSTRQERIAAGLE